jgi:hypothetical protein
MRTLLRQCSLNLLSVKTLHYTGATAKTLTSDETKKEERRIMKTEKLVGYCSYRVSGNSKDFHFPICSAIAIEKCFARKKW